MNNMLIFYISIITLAALFLQMIHPIAMLLILILSTLTIIMFMVMLLQTSWLSYILFMVMLGGLLILFVYIVTLAPNSKMMTLSYLNIFIVIMSMMTYILTSQKDYSLDHFTINFMNVMKMYYPNLTIMTSFIASFLLFTLMIIVYMTHFNNGPLRASF